VEVRTRLSLEGAEIDLLSKGMNSVLKNTFEFHSFVCEIVEGLFKVVVLWSRVNDYREKVSISSGPYGKGYPRAP
jgi:hypothetical protein